MITETCEGAYNHKYHIDKANAYKIHADLLVTGPMNTEEAIDYYELAKTAFIEVGSMLGVAAAAQSQAKILRASKNNEEAAEKLYAEAQEILEDTFKEQPSNALLIKVKEERAVNLRSLKRDQDADKLIMEAEEMRTEIKKTKDAMKAEIISANRSESIVLDA